MKTKRCIRIFCGIMCQAGTLALVLSIAAVSEANILSFQIEGARFCGMVEQAVQTFPFCPETIPGTEMVVEGIEVSDPVYLRRSPHEDLGVVSPSFDVRTHPVQLVIPLTIGLKTVDQTLDPDYNGDYGITMSLDAILHFAFDGAVLLINLNRTEPDLGDDVVEFIRSYFGGLRLPIVFDTFTSLLPGESRIIGSGVTLNDDNWLAMRVEYSDRDCDGDLTISSGWGSEEDRLRELQREQARCRTVDEAAWIDFHNGTVGPRRTGDEWNLFVDQLLLRQAIEQELYPRIVSIPDIALDGRFGSDWTPLGDFGAEIPLYFSGTYTGGYCNITFHADPFINIRLDGSEMVVEGEIGEIWRSGGDVAKCIFGMTTLFGGAFLPGLNETVASILSAVFYNYEFDMDLSGVSLGRDWDCTGDDSSLRCSIPVELPPLQATGMPEPFGTLTLEHLSGETEGLLAGGVIDVVTSEAHEYEVEIQPFEFGMANCCRDAWYAGTLLLNGYGSLCGDSPEILDDPLHVFNLERIWGGWRIRLDFAGWEDFWNDPYPARVHVRTSAGTATYELEPGPRPDDTELEGWGSACGAARHLCEIRSGFEREPEPEDMFGWWRDPEFRYETDLEKVGSDPYLDVKLDEKIEAVISDKGTISTDVKTKIVSSSDKGTISADVKTKIVSSSDKGTISADVKTKIVSSSVSTSTTEESAMTESETMSTEADAMTAGIK